MDGVSENDSELRNTTEEKEAEELHNYNTLGLLTTGARKANLILLEPDDNDSGHSARQPAIYSARSK